MAHDTGQTPADPVSGRDDDMNPRMMEHVYPTYQTGPSDLSAEERVTESQEEVNAARLKLAAAFKENEPKLMSLIAKLDLADESRYIVTLAAYTEVEDEKAAVLGLQARLANFEKSDEFKESKLTAKLSADPLFKPISDAASTAAQSRQNHLSSLGGPTGENGLSRGEVDAAHGAVDNLASSARNIAAGGGSLVSAVASLAKDLTSIATKPFVAMADRRTEQIRAAKGDDVVRLQKVAESDIEDRSSGLARAVKEFNGLAADTSPETAEAGLAAIGKQFKELKSAVDQHVKSGVDNIMDDHIPRQQKLLLASEEDLERAGQKALDAAAESMGQLGNAPALQDKEELQKKAKTMAEEAAEIAKRLIEAIRELFSRGWAAKDAGQKSEVGVGSAPRM